jgi:hypothetical protein
VTRAVLGGLLAATLLGTPALAQSPPLSWNGLSDRFQVDTGYFRLAAETQLRSNGAPGSGDIIGYIWLNARVRATGTVAGVSRSLDESASTGSVTGRTSCTSR